MDARTVARMAAKQISVHDDFGKEESAIWLKQTETEQTVALGPEDWVGPLQTLSLRKPVR